MASLQELLAGYAWASETPPPSGGAAGGSLSRLLSVPHRPIPPGAIATEEATGLEEFWRFNTPSDAEKKAFLGSIWNSFGLPQIERLGEIPRAAFHAMATGDSEPMKAAAGALMTGVRQGDELEQASGAYEAAQDALRRAQKEGRSNPALEAAVEAASTRLRAAQEAYQAGEGAAASQVAMRDWEEKKRQFIASAGSPGESLLRGGAASAIELVGNVVKSAPTAVLTGGGAGLLAAKAGGGALARLLAGSTVGAIENAAWAAAEGGDPGLGAAIGGVFGALPAARGLRRAKVPRETSLPETVPGTATAEQVQAGMPAAPSSGMPISTSAKVSLDLTQEPPLSSSVQTRLPSVTERRGAPYPETLTGGSTTRSGLGTIDASGNRVYHNIETLDELYATAEEVKPAYEVALGAAASQVPGARVATHPLAPAGARIKQREGRAATKIKERGFGPQNLGDVIGGRMSVENASDAEGILASFRRQGWEVIDDEIGFNRRVGGYVARHVNLADPSGRISVELQMVPREIAALQEVAHKHLEIMRAADVGLEQRAHAKAEMEKILAPAWKAAKERGFFDTTTAAPAAGPRLVPRPEPATRRGATATVFTPTGGAIETHYALVEADDLVTSHRADDTLSPNPAFPTELQPRDRTRIASRIQVENIEKRLNPELLGASPTTTDGAPIIGPDDIVESGNVRSIALKRNYDRGLTGADDYRHWLAVKAAAFGLDPADVVAMRKPVLVRVRDTALDRARFAEDSNVPTVAKMGTVEQARSDAARLTDDALELYADNGNGDLTTAANRTFVRAFIERLPMADQATMMDAKGALSVDGATRIKNAVLSLAYGDRVVGKLGESLDSQVKNVGAALSAEAPRFAAQRRAMASGDLYDVDLGPDIAAATEKLSLLRSQGMKVDEYLAQSEMFGRELSDEARALLEVFEEHKRSPQRIAAVLERYAELTEGAGSPKQASLLPVEPPTKTALLERAQAEWMKANEQRYLFDGPTALPNVEAALLPHPNILEKAAMRGAEALESGKFRTWWRKWFHKSGSFYALAPEDAAKMAERQKLGQAAERAYEVRGRQAITDFNYELGSFMDGLKRQGIDRSEADVLDYILAGIEGENNLGAISEGLQKTTAAMRSLVDELSTGIADSSLVGKEMREIILANRKKYLMRAFAVHRDPAAWERIVKEEQSWRWDNMKAFLREQNPDWSDVQIEGYMNRLLRRDPEVFVAIGDRGAGRVKTGPLKHRLRTYIVGVEGRDGTVRERVFTRQADAETYATERRGAGEKATIRDAPLPDVLDDFLGLPRDPRIRFADSIAAMSHMLEMNRFFEDFAKDGYGRYFFDEPLGEFSQKVGGSRGAVSEMYTSPTIKAMIEGASEAALGEHSKIWARVMQLTSAVRAGKTVGSPQTQERNAISWIPMLLAQGKFISPIRFASRSLTTIVAGHLRTGHPAVKALNAIAAGMENVMGRRLADVLPIGDVEFHRKLYNEGVRRGVFGEAASTAGELAYDVPKIFGAPGATKGPVGAVVARGVNLAKTLYSGVDDVGKALGWLSEIADYKAAYPDFSLEQLMDMTAPMVRDLYPTYSNAPRAVQALRKAVLVSDYPTFWAEILRTTKNTVKRAAEEIRSENPRIKMIGTKRLIGLTAVVATGPKALKMYYHGREGATPEDVDLAREIGPPWLKAADLAIIEKKRPGEYSVMDVSYSNPHALLREPVTAAMKALAAGDPAWEAAFDGFTELADPFIRESMVAGTAIKLATGRSKSGRSLWAPTAPMSEKLATIRDEVLTDLSPGAALSPRRLMLAAQGKADRRSGRVYDVADELLAVGLVTPEAFERYGIGALPSARVMQVSASNQVPRAAIALASARADIQGRWNKDRDLTGYSAKWKMERRRVHEESWKRAQAKIQQKIAALRAAGVSESAIWTLLRNKVGNHSTLSASAVNRLMAGELLPLSDGD